LKRGIGVGLKVLIQGLGEVPATLEFALERERPDVTYVICSEYQLENIASAGGYTEPNRAIIEAAAKKTNTKVVLETCDVFDVDSVGEAIARVFGQINAGDEVVVNYTGGAASVKLLLGVSAVVMSRVPPVRIIYAIKYPRGIEVFADQTEVIKNIFQRLKIIT
jgi:hypothetical protein